MRFQESRIPGIQGIKQASRGWNGEGICIEGVKPEVLPGESPRNVRYSVELVKALICLGSHPCGA